MSETSAVQNPGMDYAREQGCRAWKVSAEGRRDFPDVLLLCNAIWIVIECKDEGKELRPGQAREQRRIRTHGGLAFDVDNLVDFKKIVDLLVDKRISLDALKAA